MSCLRRCAAALVLVTLLCAAAAALGLRFAAGWLLDADEPRAADAILVLAGLPSRALAAADLHALGLAPLVITTQERIIETTRQLRAAGVTAPSGNDLVRAALEARGVPDAAIRAVGQDLNSTVAEAELMRATLDPSVKRLMVVTSPFHTRRARLIFSRVLPGVEIIMVASRYETWTDRWWEHKELASHIVLEVARTAWYYVGGRF